MKYCKKINENFLQLLNKKKPKTMEQLADIWYEQYGWESRSKRYHSSRYSGLNLHSTFTKFTLEFRFCNGCLHSGKIRAWLVLCLAISHQALTQKSASAKRTQTDNEKYTFRVWLNRMGLIGDEYKNCRQHLIEHLSGDSAWRTPRAA
jgi:hypothetical protein